MFMFSYLCHQVHCRSFSFLLVKCGYADIIPTLSIKVDLLVFLISDTVSLKSKITNKKKVPKGQIHKKTIRCSRIKNTTKMNLAIFTICCQSPVKMESVKLITPDQHYWSL